MRPIDKIIIHCTATPDGRQVTTDQIDQWHKQAGYNEIGYHYVIYLDGSIHTGRSLELSGAHTKGQNTNSIGICYVGGCDASMKPKDTRTAAQRASLVKLIKELKARFPGVTIHGHNEFAAKACPSFNVSQWIKEVGL